MEMYMRGGVLYTENDQAVIDLNDPETTKSLIEWLEKDNKEIKLSEDGHPIVSIEVCYKPEDLDRMINYCDRASLGRTKDWVYTFEEIKELLKIIKSQVEKINE